MPSNEKQQEESEFEAEVLRISRALFAPENEFQGSTYIGTAERDGVFIGPDLRRRSKSAVAARAVGVLRRCGEGA
ncbi:hypothetical protein [Streptomyces sp. NPDC047985]|uniref:hypothetical protein n=1 Tax=unclassified Streptomyces TaxID=2593676 RepID=UPI00342228DF